MKKITLLAFTSLIGFVLLAGAMVAKADSSMQGLNLTEKQKTQMKQISADSQVQIKPLQDEMLKNQQELQQLSMTSKPDQVKINDLADQQGKLFSQILVIKNADANKMYNLLTKTQKQKYETMMNQRMEKMKGMMDKKTEQSTPQ